MTSIKCPQCSERIKNPGRYCPRCQFGLVGTATGTDAYGSRLDTRTRTRATSSRTGATRSRSRSGRSRSRTRTRGSRSRTGRTGQPPSWVAPTRAMGLSRTGTGGERKIFVVDLSGSMRDPVERGGLFGLFTTKTKLDVTKEGLEMAADAAARCNDGSELGIIGFSSNARVYREPVDAVEGRHLVTQAIQSMKADSRTNVAAGLAGCGPMIGRGGGPARSRIVLLSDGHRTCGEDPMVIADRLKSEGVFIQTIGVAEDPSGVEERLLKGIATVVNGEPQYRFIESWDTSALITHLTDTGVTRVDY